MRITIPAGETIVNFSVPVIIDGTFETTETFNLRLDTLSSAENLGVEVGTLTNVIGQITDAGILNVHKMLAYKQGGLSHVIITYT